MVLVPLLYPHRPRDDLENHHPATVRMLKKWELN
jgi:hypothetical protein